MSMSLIKHIGQCLLYPIEGFLRFWFPYAFRDDPFNPEPQNKKERIEYSELRKRRKLEKKQSKRPTIKRRENFVERRKLKKDPEYVPTIEVKNAEKVSNREVVKKKYVDEEVENQKEANQNPLGLGIKLIDLSSELNNEEALKNMQASETNIAYYWHDESKHQVAVKFAKGGIKQEYKTRDNQERRRLEPLIYPKRKVGFDRTHVIPIGYHGSESDKRLLVGFSSKINRNYLKKFEDKVASLNSKETVLWFVDIQLQEDKSAKWFATVWNENGDVMLRRTFHDKSEFTWHKRRF